MPGQNGKCVNKALFLFIIFFTQNYFSAGETQKKSGNLEPEGKMGQSLAVSVRSQLPIRVIRGASLQNCFAPSSGYRYDGEEKFDFSSFNGPQVFFFPCYQFIIFELFSVEDGCEMGLEGMSREKKNLFTLLMSLLQNFGIEKLNWQYRRVNFRYR